MLQTRSDDMNDSSSNKPAGLSFCCDVPTHYYFTIHTKTLGYLGE